jgi:hypothetical protein
MIVGVQYDDDVGARAEGSGDSGLLIAAVPVIAIVDEDLQPSLWASRCGPSSGRPPGWWRLRCQISRTVACNVFRVRPIDRDAFAINQAWFDHLTLGVLSRTKRCLTRKS